MSGHIGSKPCRHGSLTARLFVALQVVALPAVLICAPAFAQSSEEHGTALPESSWRFIVSGDSRNCGDIVMPAIAAHSAQFAPAFYWHLGDLRAIYKIDEDMAAAAQFKKETLSCDNYQRHAWNDFAENQIAPFGDLPFYVGIGNHEVMTPKGEDAFKRQFHDWLDMPSLHRQRYFDSEPAEPEPYYHWIQGGVDFIYLDNANGFFSEEQLTWFFKRLSNDTYSSQVNSLVVGMHEALPDSIANDHSMGDGSDPRGRATGTAVYKALLALSTNPKKPKPVYVLASHAHIYLADIFNTSKLNPDGKTPVLPGWIVGTAGAVRYVRPQGAPPMNDVYGYLVGTVDAKGKITFEFKEVRESDVPQWVKERYAKNSLDWCFTNNSKNVDPIDHDPTCTK